MTGVTARTRRDGSIAPYMAGAALGFEEGTLQIHQVLAVRPTARGSSGIPLRPDWEPAAHFPETTPR